MHMHKEREKEWARESHLKAKSWFIPLDVKVLKELWHPMRMRSILISGLGGTFFQDWLLVKKSSSIDPEMPEKAIISVFPYFFVRLSR